VTLEEMRDLVMPPADEPIRKRLLSGEGKAVIL
jgi:hypothetical protein